jgi:hypothetical protein
MEIKDYFYIFGILFTFIIGIFNLKISLNNRKNSIREHVFKEQVKIMSELFIQLNKLNKIIDKLIDVPSTRIDNNFLEEIIKVENIVLENKFILPNRVFTLLVEVLDKSITYHNIVVSNDRAKIIVSYKDYYSEFNKFLETIRSSFGIDYLTQENQKLHRTILKKVD